MRSLLLIPVLTLALFVLGSAPSAVHAAYSLSDISSFGTGGHLYPPHCGPGGSGVAGEYPDGNPSSYPAGFFNNPSHYCFWEVEKVVNTCDFGFCGLDTVNNYGWQVFPYDYSGSGVSGDRCGEPPPPPLRDLCTTTGFRVRATPPTASLTPPSSTVNAGSSVTLSWSSSGANSCTSADFSTGGATAGTVTVAPPSSKTYAVTCTGAGGSANASATVTVVPAPLPPQVSISATPNPITAGASSALNWTSANATSCTSSEFATGNARSGSASTGPLFSTKTYTVTCTGAGGSASASATVVVQAQQPGQQASLSASPQSIQSGDVATLSYTCSPAAPANILPTIGTLGAATPSNPNPSVSSGSVRVAPTQTTTYTLTCYGNSIVSARATVTVSQQPQQPQPQTAPTAQLSGSPLSLAPGKSATLSWNSTNATSCTGFGFDTGGAPSGTRSTGPLSSTASYGLSCTGPGGTANAQPVTIAVITTPPAGGGGGTSCTGPASATLSSDASLVKAGTVVHLTLATTNVNGTCSITGTNGFTKNITPDSCNFSTGPIAAPAATNQSVYTLSCPGTPTEKTIVNVIPSYREF